MKVLMVEPKIEPYEKELNGLREMQAAVGGIIQALYPFEDNVAVVCNDEGLLEGLEFNRSLPSGYMGVFGSFFICGLREEDFCDLSPAQMATYKKMFHKAELLLGTNDKGLVTLCVEPQKKQAQAEKRKKDTPER